MRDLIHTRIKSALSQSRISARIGILVVLGLAGIGITAGLNIHTDRTVAEIEAKADAARQLGDATATVEKSALELRRREKDFLLRHELRYAEQYSKYAEEILGRLSAINELSAAASMHEYVRKLQAGFASHRSEFTKVVNAQKALGLDANQGLQGELRKSVHEVETKINEAKDDRLLALMLTMRRHEKDFLLRGDKRYVESLTATHEAFKKALAESSLDGATQANIGKLLDAYKADFEKFVGVELQRVEHVKLLSKIFADMQDSFEALIEQSKTLISEAGREREELKASASTTLWTMVGGIAFVLLMFSVLVAWSIVRPLRGMVGAMSKVAKGDLEISVPGMGQRNEIGELAHALEAFRERGIENRRLTSEQKEMERRTTEEKRALMSRMANDFDEAVGGIVDAVSAAAHELQAAAQTMSDTAESASRQSSAVAAASEQASTNVQMVTTATEELALSVNEIGQQVNQSSTISVKAVNEADRTNAAVQGLADAAQKIGDVVKLINNIAGQTNLLALNATIEAARAGDAGKGFAVVASEVKNLADQTAKATGEIASQISSMQEATTDSAQAILGIAATIRHMNEITTSVASAVEQQGATTQEIARNVQQAAQGTAEVSSNIADVNRANSETGAASSQVLASARDLSQQSAKLRIEVDRFLSTIKAA